MQYAMRDGNSSTIHCYGRPIVGSSPCMYNAKNLRPAGHCSFRSGLSDSIKVSSLSTQTGPAQECYAPFTTQLRPVLLTGPDLIVGIFGAL